MPRLTKKQLVFLRDGYTCQLRIAPACTAKIQVRHRKLTVHHMKPKFFGGSNEFFNLVTACQYCQRWWHRMDKPVVMIRVLICDVVNSLRLLPDLPSAGNITALPLG